MNAILTAAPAVSTSPSSGPSPATKHDGGATFGSALAAAWQDTTPRGTRAQDNRDRQPDGGAGTSEGAMPTPDTDTAAAGTPLPSFPAIAAPPADAAMPTPSATLSGIAMPAEATPDDGPTAADPPTTDQPAEVPAAIGLPEQAPVLPDAAIVGDTAPRAPGTMAVPAPLRPAGPAALAGTTATPATAATSAMAPIAGTAGITPATTALSTAPLGANPSPAPTMQTADPVVAVAGTTAVTATMAATSPLASVTIPAAAGTMSPSATAGPQATAASTPAGAPQLPEPLNRQLAGPIASLATGPHGDRTLTVNVAPEGLGPVTVKAHLGAEGLRVELTAPTDAGRDALRTLLVDLRRDLAALGHGSLSLSTTERHDAGSGTGGGGSQNAGAHGGSGQQAAPGQHAGTRSTPPGTTGTGQRQGTPDVVPDPEQPNPASGPHRQSTQLDVLA